MVVVVWNVGLFLGMLFSSFLIYFFGNVGEYDRFATFCCKKTCQNIKKYQTIFEYSLDHHFFSYLRQYKSSQQQAELYLSESWWSTTGQL